MVRKLVILATVVGALFATAAPASAHIDNRRIVWHTKWTTTRHSDYETVRVKVRVTNLSYKQKYVGACALKIWNASDHAVRVFDVSLRPRHYVEHIYKANLDGTSPTHTKVIHCHSA